MVSPSLHRLGWPVLLSYPPPPLPNPFHSFPPSFLYGIPELSLLGLDITTPTYSALFRLPPPLPSYFHPPPLPNPFHSFPQSLLYGTPELSLLGLDTHTPAYSTPSYPPPPTPLPPSTLTISLRVSSMVSLSYHCRTRPYYSPI